MAEGGGLLNRYTVNSRIVGSNPIPSATPRRIIQFNQYGRRHIPFPIHNSTLDISPGDDSVAVENRRLIAPTIKAGFTIDLSADNPAHADGLAELGIVPVVSPCSPELMHAVRLGSGSRGSAISGPRRSTNGVTARLLCRGICQLEGE